MTEQAEMRTMILDFALEQARKCSDTVRSSDLDFARIQEKFDVAGVEWHVRVTYWEDDDLVRIDGRPNKPKTDEQKMLGPFAALFNHDVDDDDDEEGAFVFLLPRAWLPAKGSADGN